MATTKQIPHQHVAVLAFPFGGHPLTLINLARNLALAIPTATFSFFSTSKSNHSLFIGPNLPSNLRLRSVPDGVPDGLVLSGHPLQAVSLFLDSSPGDFRLAINSAAEEEGAAITCVIADAFLSFSCELAAERGVPWVPVWPPLSISLAFHANAKLLRKIYGDGGEEKPVHDVIPGLSTVTVAHFPAEILKDLDSPFSRALLLLEDVLPRAKAIVVNFYKELNPPLFNSFMQSKYPDLLNVGVQTAQLTPPPPDDNAKDCLSWLDGHKPASVVYISFGTVAMLPPAELVAMAEALEEAQVPYLWALKESARGLLPEGFTERTTGKMVAWAPQLHVLAHVAVGAFVTHCGCNSVVEGLMSGVPLICRPFFGDHLLCGWMVEEHWGAGVRVSGGTVTKVGMVENIKAVVGNEAVREKAVEMKKRVVEAAGPTGNAAHDFKTLVQIVSAAN